MHRGLVVIPKTVTPTRIHENMKATDVKLDAEDMRRLCELDCNLRYLRFFMVKEGETAAEFWDEESDKALFEAEPPAKRNKAED